MIFRNLGPEELLRHVEATHATDDPLVAALAAALASVIAPESAQATLAAEYQRGRKDGLEEQLNSTGWTEALSAAQNMIDEAMATELPDAAISALLVISGELERCDDMGPLEWAKQEAEKLAQPGEDVGDQLQTPPREKRAYNDRQKQLLGWLKVGATVSRGDARRVLLEGDGATQQVVSNTIKRLIKNGRLVEMPDGRLKRVT